MIDVPMALPESSIESLGALAEMLGISEGDAMMIATEQADALLAEKEAKTIASVGKLRSNVVFMRLEDAAKRGER